MKETKRQVNDIILSLAQGSVDPTLFNQNIQTLSKLTNVMIDHIDEVETKVLELTTVNETLSTDHEKLKKSYHEKWGSEDLDPNKEHKDESLPKEYTDQDLIDELIELQK